MEKAYDDKQKRYMESVTHAVPWLRRLVAVEARVSPCGISVGQNGTGTSFSPSSSVFPYLCHSTMALHTHIAIT
jgi:hypothetical protein